MDVFPSRETSLASGMAEFPCLLRCRRCSDEPDHCHLKDHVTDHHGLSGLDAAFQDHVLDGVRRNIKHFIGFSHRGIAMTPLRTATMVLAPINPLPLAECILWFLFFLAFCARSRGVARSVRLVATLSKLRAKP